MKMRIAFVFLFIVVGLFIEGCTKVVKIDEGPSPGIQVRNSVAPQARIRMNSVAIVDKALQKWDTQYTEFKPNWLSIFSGGKAENEKYSKIAVEGTNAKRSPTGTLEVWAMFRNRIDFPLIIECRTQFFDLQEAPIEGPTSWQKVYLPQQSVSTYRELSTKVEGINYYYIEVREAK